MEISIIIPCRNEGENVVKMVQRIQAILPSDHQTEIIFVDDSDDDTPARLEQLSREYSFVRYVHRDQGDGLSTAIMTGFEHALGRWFIVMDADLQHPPESLPAVMEEMKKGQADLIIPSRFIPGGNDGGLNLWRKLVSWTARMLARILLHRVRPITDPTSGYFAIQREAAFSKPLDPIGWKILLELIVRADYSTVREVPYAFHSREQGSSKFNMKEQWNYARHLLRLIRSSEEDLRFWKFSIVGTSGVLVNMLVYIPFVKLGMPVSIAFAGATAIAMLNNFIWNNLLTWTHRKQFKLMNRFVKFYIVSLVGLGISTLAVKITHDFMGIHYLISGIIGILVATAWNFMMHNKWTFKKLADREE